MDDDDDDDDDDGLCLVFYFCAAHIKQTGPWPEMSAECVTQEQMTDDRFLLALQGW